MPERGELFEGSFAERTQTVVVISAGRRNRNLPSVIVAPVSSIRLDLDATGVYLGDAEPASGTVLLDFPFVVRRAEIDAAHSLGSVAPATLAKIDEGILYAFGLL